MPADGRVVWAPGLERVHVGAADATQRNVDNDSFRRRYRRRKLAEFQLSLAHDQPRVHRRLLATAIILVRISVIVFVIIIDARSWATLPR